MTLPLIVLSVPAILLGWFMHSPETLAKFFPMEALHEMKDPAWVGYVALGSGLMGILVGGFLYLRSFTLVENLARIFAPIHTLLKNKYYVDEIYWALFVRPTARLARALSWFDFNVIDRIFVDGFGWLSTVWSKIQSWIDDHVVDGARRRHRLERGGTWRAGPPRTKRFGSELSFGHHHGARRDADGS